MAPQAPFKVQDIAQNVNKRTEGRAGTKMDLRIELFLALDELCMEQHWWWRNKRLTVPAVIGTPSYDLSAVAPDFAEFDEVYLINPDGVTIQAGMLPILDKQAQIAAYLNNVQNTPAQYFIDTTASLQTMQLGAPSNVNQNMFGWYWAMPMVTDPGTEDIPLVPPFLHWGLVHALERRVFKFLYGVGDVRATTAENDYQNFKVIAARQRTWTDKQVESFSTGSSAVRAH